MDVQYPTALDPLSDWHDLAQLLKQHEPHPKSANCHPRQPEVLDGATSRIKESHRKLFCCHRETSVDFDSPWFPFLYAVAHGKILHKPPHALESLGPLMRRTDFIIRVESPFMAVFLVRSLDEYGGLIFVEIDRQSRWELSEEPPEWLQGIFVRDSGEALEWKCRDHGNSFRCTAFLRKAVGLSWW
ncbi:hypothetical protein DSL72_002371 [Monilinia vaccinii-corymbosi]|uniref:Uncharacterized protein n=1 Tax=Monilinia vaccinii-corymbosi TaxID=61207 RepID=A0A8A3PCD0_9HELO|nr:hypothetical protein DSL72_002371 [Monilinia vaccinii-corymbosi]